MIDAIAFACNQYQKPIDDLHPRAYVQLLSRQNNSFVRTANNKFYINSERVDEEEYTDSVLAEISLMDMSLHHNWRQVLGNDSELLKYLESLPMTNPGFLESDNADFRALEYTYSERIYQRFVDRKKKFQDFIMKEQILLNERRADLATLIETVSVSPEPEDVKQIILENARCMIYTFLAKRDDLESKILAADELLKLTTVCGTVSNAKIIYNHLETVFENAKAMIRRFCRVKDSSIHKKLEKVREKTITFLSLARRYTDSRLVAEYTDIWEKLNKVKLFAKKACMEHEIRISKCFTVMQDLEIDVRDLESYFSMNLQSVASVEKQSTTADHIEHIEGVIGEITDLITNFDNTFHGMLARTLFAQEKKTIIVIEPSAALQVFELIKRGVIGSHKIVTLTSVSEYDTSSSELMRHCHFNPRLTPSETNQLAVYLFSNVVTCDSLTETLRMRALDPSARFVYKDTLLTADGCWTQVNNFGVDDKKVLLTKELKSKLLKSIINEMSVLVHESHIRISKFTEVFKEIKRITHELITVRKSLNALKGASLTEINHDYSAYAATVPAIELETNGIIKSSLSSLVVILDEVIADTGDAERYMELRKVKANLEKEKSALSLVLKEFTTKLGKGLSEETVLNLESEFKFASRNKITTVLKSKDQNAEKLRQIRAQTTQTQNSRVTSVQIKKLEAQIRHHESRIDMVKEDYEETIEDLDRVDWSRYRKLKLIVKLLNPVADVIYKSLVQGSTSVSTGLKFELPESKKLSDGVHLVCSINNKRYASANEFSRGEGALVALAISLSAGLLNYRKTIIVDEIDAELDSVGCYSLMKGLKKLTENENMQVLVASHRAPVYCQATQVIGLYCDPETKESKLFTICNSREKCEYDDMIDPSSSSA